MLYLGNMIRSMVLWMLVWPAVFAAGVTGVGTDGCGRPSGDCCCTAPAEPVSCCGEPVDPSPCTCHVQEGEDGPALPAEIPLAESGRGVEGVAVSPAPMAEGVFRTSEVRFFPVPTFGKGPPGRRRALLQMWRC